MSKHKVLVRQVGYRFVLAQKGGPGSGNYGHAGRPGLRGGSSSARGGGIGTGGAKVETPKERIKREIAESYRMKDSTTIGELKKLASRDDTYKFKLNASMLNGGVNIIRVVQSPSSDPDVKMLKEVNVGFHESVDDVMSALDGIGAQYSVKW